ncbi:hypothetical protein G9A89_005772 [Geosiphon pyriformis]|nr:hypothetical protein G9A89_005772 [Geosiphon pyriformis]
MSNNVFVSPNLVNSLVHHGVLDVSEYFDTDHHTVFVSMGLGGLLDTCLFFFCKQANKDHWKFDVKNATANTTMLLGVFGNTVKFFNLGTMWDVIHKIMVLLAGGAFKRRWFKGFDTVHNKMLSRFHKLELLVSKLVKASCLSSSVSFALFLGTCNNLDSAGASTIRSMFFSGAKFDDICSALAKVKRSYCFFKLLKSKHTEEFHIRQAITNRMESFELDKGHTIRSVLKCSFCKVVLDHLVVNNELVLEPDLVKFKMDVIIEGWTRKCVMVDNISDTWFRQYKSLDYIFDDAFSGIMSEIDFDELHHVITSLPDGKAAVGFGFVFGSFEFLFKKAWILMISKPYEWEGVLTNTYLIVLIKTACKILSKILLDKISLACSSYDVLCNDNFLVLKGTTTQSPIFAVGSVIKDALKKNQELWLVLQNMWKVYDLVGWKHLERSLVKIKMCSKFVHFFGSIHKDQTNHVMTDFGLTNDYQVFDDVCGYRFNSHFVSESGHTESQTGLSTFLAAGAFVDDTIWVGSSQAATQYILNVAISILSFFISGLPISVAHRGESHWYLSIFLSTENLSRPSLTKAHSDVCFFTNLVLRKVVSDKQFLYLVLAVLHLIISYRMQFSYIPNALICKDLKLKAGLPMDFPSNTIHHPSFYGLKSFLQYQSESKVASLISFANSDRILGHLFSHKSHNLQVLYWWPIYSLISSVHICISVSNNFLAGMVCILLDCNLSLGGSLASAFQFHDRVPMFVILGKSLFFKFLPSFWHFGIAFMDQLHNCYGIKRLDPYDLVLEWFDLSVAFLTASYLSSSASVGAGPLNFCESDNFVATHGRLFQININSLSVYTDGFLKYLSTADYRAGAAVFFEDIDLGLGVGVQSLVLFTLAELQAILLALECMPTAHSVNLFSDNQTALDACKSELSLHIRNVIHSKNLRVSWHKVKGHFGILGNNCANSIADAAFLSGWYLLLCVDRHFLLADGGVVSSGSGFLTSSLHSDVDWLSSFRVWHPDLYMATGFTSRLTADTRTYLMKALYCWLSMAVWKHIYNKCYPSVLCLYCGKVKVSDHVFSYVADDSAHCQVLESCMSSWRSLSGLSFFSLVVLQFMSICASDLLVSLALYKSFVFNGWLQETVTVFHNSKVTGVKITDFMCSLCSAFRNNIWLVCTKYCAFMEKNGLIPADKSISIPVFGLVLRLSPGVVKLLGVTEAFGILFGFRKSCSFFSDIGNIVSVNIVV